MINGEGSKRVTKTEEKVLEVNTGYNLFMNLPIGN